MLLRRSTILRHSTNELAERAEATLDEWRTPTLPRRGRLLAAALIGTVVTVGALWLLGSTVDIGQTVGLLRKADPLLLGAALLPVAVSMIVRSWRFAVVLGPISANGRVPVRAVAPLVLASYAINSLVPMRIGDLMRAAVGSRRLSIGFPEALGSVGLERMLDVATLALIPLVVSVGGNVPSWLSGVATALLLVALVVGVGAYALRPVARRLGVTPWTWVARFVEGLRASPHTVGAAMALSLLAWFLDGLTFWVTARALDIDISWSAATLIAVASGLGGSLPGAPAAIGSFELAGTAAGVAMGIDSAGALGLVVMGHLLTVVPILFAGLVACAMMGIGWNTLGRGAIMREGEG